MSEGRVFSILASPASACYEKEKFPAARIAATLISNPNYIWHGQPGRDLQRLWVKLTATRATVVGMNQHSRRPQCANITQHGSAGQVNQGRRVRPGDRFIEMSP